MGFNWAFKGLNWKGGGQRRDGSGLVDSSCCFRSGCVLLSSVDCKVL